MVKKLELNGISGANFVGFSKNGTGGNNNHIYSSNTSQLSYDPPSYNNLINRINYSQKNHTCYYVIIPSSPNDLRNLGEQVRQSIGQNSNVWTRTQPRGAHMGVGPFSEPLEAEESNDYIKKSRYGNARVYYGK